MTDGILQRDRAEKGRLRGLELEFRAGHLRYTFFRYSRDYATTSENIVVIKNTLSGSFARGKILY